MEVLESAKVNAFYNGEVVVPSSLRSRVLCVVWEGTCIEHVSPKKDGRKTQTGEIWYPGDWTGPIVLQPEKRLSGESMLSDTHDVIALSDRGVKVITIEFSILNEILKRESGSYRRYLNRRNFKFANQDTVKLFEEAAMEDCENFVDVIDLLDCNSALHRLTAVQKRHLESLVEGPVFYESGQRLWRAGSQNNNAFIIVSGTVSFVPRRRNLGSLPTGGLVFSRGHFLGDVSKMIAGLLCDGDEEDVIVHSSTLAAGQDGCVVLLLPKTSLIPFLDENPGVTLSFLGTQVIV